MKVTIKSVEIGVAVLLLALGALIFYKSIELGPGWGFSGPEPGFFPLAMTILIIVGCVLVLIVTFRQPAGETFFEVSQEVVDLLKVGVPILLAVILLRWLGMYLTSGIYLGLFMIFYGKYKWWNGAAAGVIFLAILWLILNEAFNLSMPKSVFYPELLPF